MATVLVPGKLDKPNASQMSLYSIQDVVAKETSYMWDEFRRNELPSLSLQESGPVSRTGQEPVHVQIMQKMAVHLRHACVESLATLLMHRGILSAKERALYLQPVWPAGTSKQEHLSYVLIDRAKLPVTADQCFEALYLSLRDSYEEASSIPTNNHYIIAQLLLDEAKTCIKCEDSYTDSFSELSAVIDRVPQSESDFDQTKASLLMQNLGFQSATKFTSYQQICLHWLDIGGIKCTMGYLVLALMKSGLGKLTSGLQPVYRSNPPRFQNFVMNLSAIGHTTSYNWKSLAYFLGYKDTDPEVYYVDKHCPLPELKPRMFLRVFRLPDCEQEMESVVSEISSGVIKQRITTENNDNQVQKKFAPSTQPSKSPPPWPLRPTSQNKKESPQNHPPPPSYSVQASLLDTCMIGNDWPLVDTILDSMQLLGEELHSDEGKTAFHYVCREGSIVRVRRMIAKGAKVTHIDKSGQSVLHYNAVFKNEQLLKILLIDFKNKGVSVDVCDKESFLTPLMMVCTIGDDAYGSAKLLLDYGANPNGNPNAHSTPLIVACQGAHDTFELVELLVERGADINKQDKDGYTLLLKACTNRNWNVAKYVLGLPHLTTINRSDRGGTTPLFEAVSQNKPEMVELLLSKGARTTDVWLQVNNVPSLGSRSVEETPFVHACRHGMLEIAKLLVKYNVDVNYKCSAGSVPAIVFALVNHKNNIVHYLLHDCEKLDTTIYGLSTPIVYSVKVGNDQCTKWMLDKLGGVERAAEEAEKIGMIDLLQHIDQYRMTSLTTGYEVSTHQSHDTVDMGLASHGDQIEETLYQFSKICMMVVKSKINLSDLASIAGADNSHVPEIGNFFKRCASGFQDESSFKMDFIGPHKNVSPLSYVVQQGCLARQEFMHHADLYFKGSSEAQKFINRLVHTIDSISGDTESVSWNGDIVLERLFNGQFSLSSTRGQPTYGLGAQEMMPQPPHVDSDSEQSLGTESLSSLSNTGTADTHTSLHVHQDSEEDSTDIHSYCSVQQLSHTLTASNSANFNSKWKLTNKILGNGAYGYVRIVEMNGKEYAAKVLHPSSFKQERTNKIMKRYQTEFEVLSSLQHRNIVGYIGGTFNNEHGFPLLVMEKMEIDLHRYLEQNQGLKLEQKFSILDDTASGLHFLHTRYPVVIHRDLSARNVLLDSNLVAKIADFGTSAIIDPSDRSRTMTAHPGTLLYMAPEALAQETRARYGPSIDIFSFGHLSIFTISQQFPSYLLQPTYQKKRNGPLLARTEVQRRAEYIEKLYQILPKDHKVIRLIKSCLHNSPHQRPTTLDILYSLESAQEELRSESPGTTLELRSYYNAYQQALKRGVRIGLKYLKMVMVGPPRSGKSSMMKRLLGEIINLQSIGQITQPSTGMADVRHVFVKPAEDRMKNVTALISETQTECAWSAVGNDKGQSGTIDLDEELRLFYNFIIEGINLQKKHEQATNSTKEETMQTVSEKTKPTTDDQETSTTSSTTSSNTNAEIVAMSNDRDEPERKMSISELKEIEDVFEAFNKILETGQQQLKVLLEKTFLLNMVDTGGQPAFIEMLPLLTIGPALYLIFLRLDQELKQRYDIQYVSEDNEKVTLGKSSYTLQEVIFQVLSSIMCFKSFPHSPKQVSGYPQAAMLVGTYKDKLKGSPEEVRTKIKKIDSALQSDLHLKGSDLFQAHQDMFQYAFPHDDQLILDADNMTGDEEEVKTIRKRLEEVISRELSTPEIPASWLMFGLFLQRIGKCTTSISQCEEVGRRLHMNDVREAIWFLHHCIGVLMYYPDVEELKDVVICDPQIVFDSVTKLILNSFTLQNVKKAVRDNFKQKGQFCFSEIQKLSKNLKSGILPLPQLVKLLEHRFIIARISHHASTSTPKADAVSSETPLSASISEAENVIYFMPAVLQSAQDNELNMSDSQNPANPVPLLIRFKSGIVPVGVFCACIASLVAQQEQLKWLLMDPTQSGYILYKDRVTFRVSISSGDYDVTLISKPKRYEVHITQYPFSASEQPSYDICQHVLENVCHTLDDVISKIRYKGLISPTDCQEKRESPYELGFRCPLHPEAHDEHMAVFRPLSGQPSQTAYELLLDYSEKKARLFCLHEKRMVHLMELLQSSECQATCFYKKCSLWMGPNYYTKPSKEDIFMKILREEWKIPKKDITVLIGNGINSIEFFCKSVTVDDLKKLEGLTLGGKIRLIEHLSSNPPCPNDTASSSYDGDQVLPQTDPQQAGGQEGEQPGATASEAQQQNRPNPGTPMHTENDLSSGDDDADPVPILVLECTKLRPEQLREKVELILHTCNPKENQAVVKSLTPPTIDGYKIAENVVYDYEGFATIGMFGTKLAAVTFTGQGDEALRDLRKTVEKYENAKAIVGIGVGYGNADNVKICLGDVMVSEKIVKGKKRDTGDEYSFDHNVPVNATLLGHARGVYLNWSDKKFPVATNPDRKSKVHLGTIVSTNTVVRAAATRKKLMATDDKAIGGEMEGWVQLEILQEMLDKGRIISIIVVKGVADFGDEKKDKVWQPTAAMAAVDFMHYVLRFGGPL